MWEILRDLRSVAVRQQDLNSIRDATALYDEYYSSILQDIEELSDPRVVRALGVIPLFRSLDRSNVDSRRLEAAFAIRIDDLWETFVQLHERELVDIYEDEVVRISDQVLRTYLFLN